MRGEIQQLSTGWVELALRIRPDEIDQLVTLLRGLSSESHFHLRAVFGEASDAPGIADVEISLQGDNEVDNLSAR